MTGREADHDRLREATAAYVVGALPADERAELETHLAGCDRCRAEVVALAPVPGLLARVPEDELDLPATGGGSGADGVVAAVRADVERLRTSRRRWRVAAGVTAAAAAVAVALGVLGVGDDDPSGRFAPDGVALAMRSSADVTGSIVADERAWGTYVYVTLAGLPARDSYELWVVDRDGSWHRAGTWAPTPTGEARLGGSTHIPLPDIDRLVVTSSDRDDEVVVAA